MNNRRQLDLSFKLINSYLINAHDTSNSVKAISVMLLKTNSKNNRHLRTTNYNSYFLRYMYLLDYAHPR